MGILNVTPDSFSDGGRHAIPAIAIKAGMAMIAAGADILDVGGESTRPGSVAVSPEIEQDRVLPVIRALAASGALVSVDTRHASTMAAALAAGAAIVNDVSALTHDPDALSVVARAGCPVVLMHMRGTPETMNGLACYDNVVSDVRAELAETLARAVHGGVAAERIALDPGIGFAKTAEQSLALLRGLPDLTTLGRPLLVGVSRKSFIGRIAEQPDAARRVGGSLAAGLYALSRGARILRVHDVEETVQAVRVWSSLTN